MAKLQLGGTKTCNFQITASKKHTGRMSVLSAYHSNHLEFHRHSKTYRDIRANHYKILLDGISLLSKIN